MEDIPERGHIVPPSRKPEGQEVYHFESSLEFMFAEKLYTTKAAVLKFWHALLVRIIGASRTEMNAF